MTDPGTSLPDSLNPCVLVRASARTVVAQADHVRIDDAALDGVAETCLGLLETMKLSWDDEGMHYAADAAAQGPQTAQFLFVVDAINFCFWPCPELEYAELVGVLKERMEAEPEAFTGERLAGIEAAQLRAWYQAASLEIPQVEERARCLRQLGAALVMEFEGLAMNLVRRAGNSAARLVWLITSRLPAFRDETLYKGRQIYFYKRAQILVGDLWGAYGKRTDLGTEVGPCCFPDIGCLTMFADYRVPQVLRHAGALVYASNLARRVDHQDQILAGSEEEVEIRAATVEAVERLRAKLDARGRSLCAAEVDWMLWTYGEARREAIGPHHRTLGIFY